jgi:hypothetical protein
MLTSAAMVLSGLLSAGRTPRQRDEREPTPLDDPKRSETGIAYVVVPYVAMIDGSENTKGLRSARSSRRQVMTATWRRGAGDAWIKREGMRNAESRPEKPCRAGEPDTRKPVSPVRWGGDRNLAWKQEKALAPYPT